LGWPAALLLLALLAVLVMPALRSLVPAARFPRIAGSQELSVLQFLPFLGVLGVLAHNLIDFNLQFVGVVLPVTLVLAMMVRGGTQLPSANNKFVHLSGFVVAGVLLLLALCEGVFISTQVLARRAEERGAFASALTWYRRSHASWYPRDLWLGEGRLLIALKRPEEAQEAAQTALDLNAYDARAWEMLADTQVITGERAAALQSATEAYRFGRMLDIGTARLFLGLLLSEDHAAALGRFPEFDALAGIYAAAMQRNAHFVLLSGNVEEFLRFIDLLSVLSPKDEPRLQGMAAGADRLATAARQERAAAQTGFLW
ncbi:MAG: hypothetical protein PHS73_03365, partial [Candidatus Peribacteraceae bacterium]|nr:hypothetical protein [Candidatus Peribacteraceae bacterium]